MGGIAPGALAGGLEGLGGGAGAALGGGALAPQFPVIPPPEPLDVPAMTGQSQVPVAQMMATEPLPPPQSQPSAQATDLAMMLQRAQDMQRMLPIEQAQRGFQATSPPQYQRANQAWQPNNLILHDYGVPKGVDLSKTAQNPYHSLVYPDGSIRYRYPDNPYGQSAPHSYLMNPDAIGLSYAGPVGGQPTPEGLAALQAEYNRIQQMFPGIKSMGHGEAYQATIGKPNQASKSGRDLSEASWRTQIIRDPQLADAVNAAMAKSPPPLQQFPQVAQAEFPPSLQPNLAPPGPPSPLAAQLQAAPPPPPQPEPPVPMAQRGITSYANMERPTAPDGSASAQVQLPQTAQVQASPNAPVQPPTPFGPPPPPRPAMPGFVSPQAQTALSQALTSGAAARPNPIAIRSVPTQTIPAGPAYDPGRFAASGMAPTAQALNAPVVPPDGSLAAAGGAGRFAQPQMGASADVAAQPAVPAGGSSVGLSPSEIARMNQQYGVDLNKPIQPPSPMVAQPMPPQDGPTTATIAGGAKPEIPPLPTSRKVAETDMSRMLREGTNALAGRIGTKVDETGQPIAGDKTKLAGLNWGSASRMMALGKPTPISVPPASDVPSQKRPPAPRPPSEPRMRRFRSAFPINEG